MYSTQASFRQLISVLIRSLRIINCVLLLCPLGVLSLVPVKVSLHFLQKHLRVLGFAICNKIIRYEVDQYIAFIDQLLLHEVFVDQSSIGILYVVRKPLLLLDKRHRS